MWLVKSGILFLILMSCAFSVIAEDFVLTEQRYITTGENSDYYYIQIHKADGTNSYIGINKITKGSIGIADDDEFFGNMWLVPAFRHPVNSQWYLCPIMDMATISSVQDLGDGWHISASDSALVCYQYSDLSLTGTANVSVRFSFEAQPDAKVKINVNTTISGVSPSDTGFGFVFFPTNPEKYRYVTINGINYDLVEYIDSNIPVDKIVEFLDSSENPIGHVFDWTDMLDTGNRFARIMTINSKKALFLGTYGYGASNIISIDPIYSVDYSPVPAEHIYYGLVNSSPDSAFLNQVDIADGVSDNLTGTSYETNLITTDNRTIDYTDSTFEVVEYLGAQGDIFAIQVNLTKSSIVGDIEVCAIAGIGTLGVGNLAVNETDTGITFNLPVTTTPTEWRCVILPKSLALDGVQRIGISRTSTGSPPVNYRIYIQSDTTVPMNTSYLYQPPTWTLQSDRNYAIRLNYNVSNFSLGKAVVGRWSVTYDSGFDWFLRLYKTNFSNNTINVHAYQNSNDLANLYTTKELNGEGWFNVNVSSLMDYEKNVSNMTFTQFRIFFDTDDNISEIRLRKETNDTQPPMINVSECYITNVGTGLEDYTFGCLEGIEFECNDIYDELDIEQVLFTINNQNYSADQLINHWHHYEYPTDNGTIVFDWTKVIATDIVGNKAEVTVDLQANYTCIFEEYINITHQSVVGVDILNLSNTTATIVWTTNNPSSSIVTYRIGDNLSMSYGLSNVTYHSVPLTGLEPESLYFYNVTSTANPTQTIGEFNFTTLSGCIENWVLDSYTCQTNDTYIATYTDTNSCGSYDLLPVENGTFQYCNYCSEDLVHFLGECTVFGNQTVDYYDNNFFSCCDVTGLYSDCSILYYPYNDTTSQSCTYYQNELGDINCQNEPNFNLREKEYCMARIPFQYMNESFKCLSYVTRQDTGEIMQTNPEYRERAQTFFDFGQDPESRQYFEPANTLVNFYYTQKNLFPEQDYTLTVECSSNERVLTSQLGFQIAYENYEGVFYRTRWLMSNTGYIITAILVIFIILAIILIVYNALR